MWLNWIVEWIYLHWILVLLCIRFGHVCLSSQATTFDLINESIHTEWFQMRKATSQTVPVLQMDSLPISCDISTCNNIGGKHQRKSLVSQLVIVNEPLAWTIFCAGISKLIFIVNVMKKRMRSKTSRKYHILPHLPIFERSLLHWKIWLRSLMVWVCVCVCVCVCVSVSDVFCVKFTEIASCLCHVWNVV